jgi:uncharacterized protein YkwD
MVRVSRRWRIGIIFGVVLAAALSLAVGAKPAAAIRKQHPSTRAQVTASPASVELVATDILTNTVFLPLIRNGNTPEAEVAVLTNQERAKVGCPALRISSQLDAAAEGHSADMAVNDYFSHTSLDGRSPWDRINATGYSFSRAAENIAAGYSTPAAVVQGWMNSDGHRANILNCSLTEIGVGYVYLAGDTGSVNYRHYWTQVFATPRD